jgi:hypothetical protein
MKASIHEAIPTVWVEARDIPFFRLVRNVFTPAFLAGASVLLASYDDIDEAAPVTECHRIAEQPTDPWSDTFTSPGAGRQS